jgi:hypothetical protein
MIDPVALGAGKRFFPDDSALRAWSLVDGQVTGKGALLATYARAR